MKKVISVLLAVLLAWNLLLSYFIFSKNKNTNDGKTPVMNNVNGYTTDVTEVIKEHRSSLVTIKGKELDYSGLIYATNDKTSYIFTTALPANEGTQIVRFDSGAEEEAEIIGYDAETGLTLLSCKTDFKTTPFTIGDSSIVSSGEYVIGIGARDFTNAQTVSFGVSSQEAMYHTSVDSEWVTCMLETDLSQKERMTGGAVCNIAGELIGIITKPPFYGSDNFTYCISVNEMKHIYTDLKKNHEVTRGSLNIFVRSISSLESYEENELGLQLDRTNGVLVTSVPASSVCFGKLRPKDVITAIDNHVIRDVSDYMNVLYEYASLDSVTVTYLHEGKSESFTVTFP